VCGICGVVNFDSEQQVLEPVLRRMTDVIAHRGPDDSGLYLNGNVGLGFRRLSIVDLTLGHQPMSNEDGRVWIVFNGEIYNHADIRKRLISHGHVYKTKADTETIIHLYEQDGVDGFNQMNGMYAFAIWDDAQKRLVLVRDRLGIKPFYYMVHDNRLLFGSEIKAILEYPGVPREVNDEALEEYLVFRFPAGEQTMFKGIKSLLPGHVLIWENGRVTTTKTWDVPVAEERLKLDEATAMRQLEELLDDSVQLRLMSDVPLGTMCSGGVDSGLTTAYASLAGKFKLNTYSVGFQEEAFDETRYARMVADKYGTSHHELVVSNLQFADSLEKMIWHYDEPLNHANSVQIFHISKLAKEKITVMLTGEGADELFGGYPRYYIPQLLSNMQWMPQFSRQAVGALAGLAPAHKIRKLGQYLPLSTQDAALYNAAFVQPKLARSVLVPDVSSSRMEYRRSLLKESERLGGDLMNRLFYLELKTYLVAILHRMDKMTMAARVEGRVPFLDYRLVEWAARLPLNLKLNRLENKRLVKRLGEKMLPRDVIYRQKSGFGVPLGEWFRDRSGLGRFLDIFQEPTCTSRGLFNGAQVARLVEEHRSRKSDHSDILWELINLELWMRIFIAPVYD
jgi:asparagine synthase (glutamine-hydrolysing)